MQRKKTKLYSFCIAAAAAAGGGGVGKNVISVGIFAIPLIRRQARLQHFDYIKP
jgi:hypothetical protein